jgi:hypothetical protein
MSAYTVSYILTDWEIRVGRRGDIYVVGDYEGRGWETTSIQSMHRIEAERMYIVHTVNSCYYLYY